MDQPDFEYRGLMASLWDFFRGDTSTWADRFFYQEVIRRHGQPVLDVGCGTGRLLLDYLSQGIDIDGVDISPEMLALCRDKAEKLGLRPNVFQQSMEALDLPRRYSTIVVPSSSFQLVTDLRLAAATMQRFYEHLEHRGALVMPFMVLRQNGDRPQTDWELTERARSADGAVVRRWSRAWFDMDLQLEHTEDRYEISLSGEVIATEHHRRSPATRWYTQEQAQHLYQRAGFANIQLYSEFSFEPAQVTDALFSVVGERP